MLMEWEKGSGGHLHRQGVWCLSLAAVHTYFAGQGILDDHKWLMHINMHILAIASSNDV